MNIKRENRKRKECLTHRLEQYDKSLDLLIKGEVSPEYVKFRADKITWVK